MQTPFSTPYWVTAIWKLIPVKSPQGKIRVQNLYQNGSKYLEMGGELTPNYRNKSCSKWFFLHQNPLLFWILRPDFWEVSMARYLLLIWTWPFPGLVFALAGRLCCRTSISVQLWRWRSIESPFHEDFNDIYTYWIILHGSKVIQPPPGPTLKNLVPGDLSFVT